MRKVEAELAMFHQVGNHITAASSGIEGLIAEIEEQLLILAQVYDTQPSSVFRERFNVVVKDGYFISNQLYAYGTTLHYIANSYAKFLGHNRYQPQVFNYTTTPFGEISD